MKFQKIFEEGVFMRALLELGEGVRGCVFFDYEDPGVVSEVFIL